MSHAEIISDQLHFHNIILKLSLLSLNLKLMLRTKTFIEFQLMSALLELSALLNHRFQTDWYGTDTKTTEVQQLE